MIIPGSKYPKEAGASKARRVDTNAKNPFVENKVSASNEVILSEFYEFLTCNLNLLPKEIEQIKELIGNK